MTSHFDEVVAALRQPCVYPHRPDVVDVRETAISIVFLAGDRVFKVKKPVTLPFLDYADPERRRDLCRDEVALNRRLAPTTYLGVRAIVRRDGGLALDDDRDDAVEWAVEMRRLPEHRTMAALLAAGRLTSEHVRAVGSRLAAFHADAQAPADPPGPGAVKRPSDENFQALLDLELPAPERRRLTAAARFSDAFVAGRRDTLAARAASGRIRDGHGDLRLEHVLLLDEGVIVYDTVEFDPALRRIDVASDLAFLVMELVAAGAEPYARELVAAYRDAGGDPGEGSLVAFYAAYRAMVRAKLAYLADGEPTRLVEVAERLRWRARLPVVLVLCGVTATGKSTLAAHLAEASGFAVLDSDRLRKELAGIEPTSRASDEIYGREVSRQTYEELGNRAADRIRDRGGVVIDATCRRLAERRALLEPLEGSVAPILFVECRAPHGVLLERARRRQHDPRRQSDATPAMVDPQLAEWESLDEVPAAAQITVRADQDPAEIVDKIEALLDRRLTHAGR